MKFIQLRSAALALVCLLGFGIASSAQTTTITASQLRLSGYPISTGEVTFTPVNAIGNPIPFADGSGDQNGPTAFACQIVNGAITGAIDQSGSVSGPCEVPDATQTTPANILYQIQVSDQSTGLRTSGYSYTMQAVIGVSGETWALDHYGPPTSTSNVQAVQAAQGFSLPSPCISPSIFTLLFVESYAGTYTCVNGTEVQIGGSSTPTTSLVLSGDPSGILPTLKLESVDSGSSADLLDGFTSAGVKVFSMSRAGDTVSTASQTANTAQFIGQQDSVGIGTLGGGFSGLGGGGSFVSTLELDGGANLANLLLDLYDYDGNEVGSMDGEGNLAIPSVTSTLSSAETVSFSATPTFSLATRLSRIFLTGNITSFTLPPGQDGQEKTLCFVQGSAAYTVNPPADVVGFFTIGSTPGHRNCQHFSFDATTNVWYADAVGITNE